MRRTPILIGFLLGSLACRPRGSVGVQDRATTPVPGARSAESSPLAEFVSEIPFQSELSSAPSGLAVGPDGTL
jgi:hypothetical protein